MNLKALKSSVMGNLVMLSILRYVPVYLVLFWDIYVGLASVIVSYFCHQQVKAYFGFSLWSFKQLDDPNELIRLKRWMVPKRDEKADMDWVDKLLPATKEWLRNEVKDKGVVCVFDFMNAELIETQYFKQRHHDVQNNFRQDAFIENREK